VVVPSVTLFLVPQSDFSDVQGSQTTTFPANCIKFSLWQVEKLMQFARRLEAR